MSVFLSNLDDYINPSQACINPFVLSKGNKDDSIKDNSIDSNGSSSNSNSNSIKKKIVIETDTSDIGLGKLNNDIKPNIIKTTTTSKNIKVASISLNDCLACSGCVTTAEANLIADQGIDKFKLVMKQKRELTSNQKPTIFIILSPQSRASLTYMFNIGLTNNNNDDDKIDNKWNLSETFLKLATFFKNMGVDYVLDGSSTGDIALIESREEFVNKWMNNYTTNSINNEDKKIIWAKPPTSLSVSSTKKRIFNNSTSTTIGASYFLESNEGTIVDNSIINNDNNLMPMFISHCPGWICYAEKTSPQSLPYISTSKSSQQIAGVIIKKILSKDNNKNDIPTYNNPYIISIQPCYDKKLEGSRLDFFHDDINSHEIDLVLSTSELWSLLEEEVGLELGLESNRSKMELDNYESNIKASNHDNESTTTATTNNNNNYNNNNTSTTTSNSDINVRTVSQFVRLLPADSSEGKDFVEHLFRCYSQDGLELVLSSSSSGIKCGSGGYLEHIFRYASEKLLGLSLWNQPLEYKVGRNADISEVEVTGDLIFHPDNNKPVTLKMAKAYGFRNIQSLMLKMKKGKCDLDLVEIMACPNGCNNGGGQLKVTAGDKETSVEANSRILEVDQIYSSIILSNPIDSPLAKFLYKNLGTPYSPLAREILHTNYHNVPKLEEIAPLASKW